MGLCKSGSAYGSHSTLIIFFLFYYLTIFKLLFYYSCPNFSPLPSSVHPTLGSHSHFHTVVHVHRSFTHDLCPVPSPFFHHLSPSPLVTFSLLHVSMPVVQFCLLVYFVHYFCLFISRPVSLHLHPFSSHSLGSETALKYLSKTKGKKSKIKREIEYKRSKEKRKKETNP